MSGNVELVSGTSAHSEIQLISGKLKSPIYTDTEPYGRQQQRIRRINFTEAFDFNIIHAENQTQ